VLNLTFQKSLLALTTLVILAIFPSTVIADEKPAEASRDPLLSAMRKELNRAKKDLRLPGQPMPYFIEFWVQESVSTSLMGKYGGITYSTSELHPVRYAGVQVRVGDYSLDNTNLPLNARFDQASYAEYKEENDSRRIQMPLDGNELALRTTLWLLSDAAYKRAIVDYQKKKSLQVTGIENDKSDDFTREKSVIALEPPAEIKISLDSEEWKEVVRKVTDYLARQPNIMEPSMDIHVSRDINYYVNTEGTVLRTSAIIYNFNITAWTRTEDGMKVSDFRHVLVRDPNEVPDLEKLLSEAKGLAQELADLRSAEEFNPYTGPAILAPDVAGVFFHEALGHRLEGERQRMTDSGQTFKGKVGENILSDQITVTDDPTLDRFNGKSLVGHYRYDDEGVAAQKVVLIEKGRLKSYLMSRTPIKGFNNSNGHGRSQNPAYIPFNGHPVGRMGNLMVESDKKYSLEKMKEMLIAEAKKQGKAYGLIIRHVYGGDTDTQKGQQSSNSGEHYQAFKATPVLVYAVDVATGKERLVRGVELVGTPLASLEKVIAAGNDPEAFNGMCGAESGWVPVSVVSPSILTAQVELQRIGGNPKRSPILLSPFLEKAK
jgi:TldD protein